MREYTEEVSDDLRRTREEEEHRRKELVLLFGEDTVAQAGQIDVADLNMNEQMTAAISDGVRRLKALRNDPNAQQRLISDMDPGTRLVLCMWIMDMELLQKISEPREPSITGDGV